MDTISDTTIVAILLLFAANSGVAGEPAPGKVAHKQVKLPGIVIDVEKQCVDLEATVCLNEGFLELIACTKGSKEHESIVAVSARPMHIHTALLLLGASNGKPAMRKQIGTEDKRWVNIPPQGDAIRAFLLFQSPNGSVSEFPVSNFVKRADEQPGKQREKSDQQDTAAFPGKFVFAGSHLRDTTKGPREYLADSSGNVISVVTFGDELLCLPGIQSRANGALSWKVNAAHLPKTGTKVKLRLRPEKKQRTGVKK